MSELCKTHVPIARVFPTLLRSIVSNAPGASASVQATLNRQRGELQADLRIEELVLKSRGRGSSTLKRRPIRNDWCAAQSQPTEGVFDFCGWLTTPTCPYYKASAAGEIASSGISQQIVPRNTLSGVRGPLMASDDAEIKMPPRVAESKRSLAPSPENGLFR